jgi:uncharacterized membrane protein YgaE (UPF0421/DUF939 family)
MFTSFLPEQMIVRRSIRAAVVIFIAVIISQFFAFSEKFWIPTATLLVLQTAVGLTVRQGLQRFLMITFSVLVASYVVLIVKNSYVVNVIAVIFLSIICYFSLATYKIQAQITIPLMMGIVVLIAMIMPPLPAQVIHSRTLDVIMGGVMGILASLFILPVRVDVEFRKEVLPLLASCLSYFQAIIEYFYDHKNENNLISQRRKLEMIWQEFPDWVYETGFIASLQEGYRHFLVRIDQMRQILAVLHYLASFDYEEQLLQQLKEPMDNYVEQVRKMVHAISTLLVLQKLSEGAEELDDSFNQLEITFKQLVPYSLETLAINLESVDLAHFIYELQEFGKILTIVARTLR